MPIGANSGMGRAWNSWSPRPAELVFLPLGLRLTPVLYASSQRKASLITAGKDITFLEHTTDGSAIRFLTRHAGTTLSWAYDRPDPADPWTVTGQWQAQEFGEWALRYWVSLCLSGEAGETVTLCPESGALMIRQDQRWLALVTDHAPVQVTAHENPEALAADFEARGYFTKAARGTEGPCLALRFTLEMSARTRFALSLADAPQLAVAKARAALARAGERALPPLQTGRHAGALDAVRDIMGWNTLYDRQNHRAYTPASRIWNLGAFAVWFNDATYNALMAGLFEADLARDNLNSALASATPQGNFAAIVTSEDAWVDRSQPPNGALVAWLLYARTRDLSLLQTSYPLLAANHRWWRANRDPDGIGLVSCGSSEVGDGLYKGSHFGARNETGMDNSPTHDEARWQEADRSLSLIDLGLNCQLALDGEMLARIARQLGRAEEAAEFSALAEATREKIRSHLWDDSRGIFANRHRGGGFVKALGPTSFYPLFCDAVSAPQLERLLAHLEDPATFGGDYVIPTISRQDPAFQDNVYWRGRIWANVNWFVWQGLRRQNRLQEAGRFAEKSMRMFMQNWQNDRIASENYNAVTGEGCDQLDADPFYSWAAMLPLIGMGEVMDLSPWNGWEISLTGEDVTLGPLRMPPGEVTLKVTGDQMKLCLGQGLLFATDGYRGRICEIDCSAQLLTMVLRPEGPARGRLILPPGCRDLHCFVDGRKVEAGEAGLDLTGLAPGSRLSLLRA